MWNRCNIKNIDTKGKKVNSSKGSIFVMDISGNLLSWQQGNSVTGVTRSNDGTGQ